MLHAMVGSWILNDDTENKSKNNNKERKAVGKTSKIYNILTGSHLTDTAIKGGGAGTAQLSNLSI